MNTTEYKEKMEALVGDENTYTKLNKDPTNKYKNKLVGTLRRWKREEQISDNLYWRLYPDSEEPRNSMALLRSTKRTTPWDQSYPAAIVSHTELPNAWQAYWLP